jgi:hypothetical protein
MDSKNFALTLSLVFLAVASEGEALMPVKPPVQTPSSAEVPANDSNASYITILYATLLERAPDSKGYQTWLKALNGGMSRTQITLDFLTCPEYAARHASDPNEVFVTVLYATLLGRAPDASGLQSWLNLLNQGMSRNQVAKAFVNGAEFIAKHPGTQAGTCISNGSCSAPLKCGAKLGSSNITTGRDNCGAACHKTGYLDCKTMDTTNYACIKTICTDLTPLQLL